MANPYRVKPTDYFQHTVIAADDTYLYRLNDGGQYERMDKSVVGTWATTSTYTGVASGYAPRPSYLILESGTHLIAGTVAGQDKVYRSTDGGINWTFVADLNAGLLEGNRGWCELNGVVYLGEYDSTGANTEVKLYSITDDGATLNTLNTWTGDNGVTDAGTIKHIHCVNAINNYIYVGTGDGGSDETQCGIIRWDPATASDWTGVGDTAPVNVNATGFIGVGGSQKYRATDLVEFNGKIYQFTDASTEFSGDRGIWQMDADLTNHVNINNDLEDVMQESSGYFACNAGSQILFTTLTDSAGGLDNEAYLWALRPGSVCERVAVYRFYATSGQKNLPSFFADGDNVYITHTNAAGDNKALKSTTVIQMTSEEFKGPLLDVIHPVYWCSSTGDAGNDASDPRNAKLTIEDCLSSASADQISQGACLMVEDATYTESAFTYGAWNTTTRAAENVYTQVRGSGRESTVITITGGTNGMTQVTSGVTKILFSDLTIDYHGSTSGSVISGTSSTTNTGEIYAQDCIIGLEGRDFRRSIYPRNTLARLWRTKLNYGSGTTPTLVNMTDNGASYQNHKIQLYACILNGGTRSSFLYNDAAFEAYHCAFINYGLAGIATQATSTVLPIAKGCVFIGANTDGSSTPFDDDASQTWSETNIDLNILDRPSNTDGVPNTELEGSDNWLFLPNETYNPRTAGVLFEDPLNSDFTPTTPYKNARRMGQKYTDYGYDGTAFTATPRISPYGDDTGSLGGAGVTGIISNSIISR